MVLTQEQKRRKNELLNKYENQRYLYPGEIEELKMLIQNDEEYEQGLKMIIAFGLGALLSYLLTKKE